MFLPIGDTPNPKRFTAWVNWALIAANVAVYLLISLPQSFVAVSPSDPLLAEYFDRVLRPYLPAGANLRDVAAGLSAYDLFVYAHGYKPAQPAIDDLFSSLFLHGGALHLAGNMLFLWIYGDNVEHRLGRVTYLLAYLSTGVAATLSFGALSGDTSQPLVGASGAISGVLGFYFVFFPRNKVKVFVALFPFLVDVVLVPARFVLAVYVIIDNFFPLLIGASGNVAHGAHLGGFFSGLLLAGIAERVGFHGPSPMQKVPRVAGTTSELSLLREALATGDGRAALDQALALPPRALYGLQAAETATVGRLLTAAGYDAVPLLRRFIGAHPRDRDLARVHLALAEARIAQGQTPAAYQHLLTALELDPEPAVAEEARRALKEIDLYVRRRRS